MGALLDKPITEKETAELSTTDGSLLFSVSAMQGWRVEMEDSHTIEPGIAGLADHSFVAVYDGHGGAFCAKFAGQQMLRLLQASAGFRAYVEAGSRARPERTNFLEQALREAFMQADVELRQEPEIRDQADRSGCTAIAAIITPTHVVIAHAGDSRAVFCSGGRVIARTDDHKPYNEKEKARIEKAGGCVSMKRVDGDLAVSRALGDFQYKDASMDPKACKVTALADTQQRPRDARADQLLIVACDGVWDVMDDAEAMNCVMEVSSEGETSLGLIAEELLDQCLFKGSRDNMSAVLVAFPGWRPGTGTGASSGGGGVAARRRRRAEERAAEEGKGLDDDVQADPAMSGMAKA